MQKVNNLKDSFENTAKWTKNNPGNIEYYCQYCGVYVAGKPRCSECCTDDTRK